MESRFRTWWIGLFVAAGLLMTVPAAAGATTYAPLNRPGPKLTVPAAKLAAALQCDAPLAGAAHPPVLLVPGTTLNPTTDFSYGWEPTLRQLGYRYCTINLPGNAMANIETAGEYVVSAIRTMHAAYGGRIDIIGHSQGGMVPRWALRFWPDTRTMVDDLIGLSPSNHGTLDAIPLCKVGCAASIWQQRSNAKFIAALNSRTETFAGVSYTNVYTLTDEVVVPNFGPAASSALHGGGGAITNVAIQTVCPTDPTEHIGIGIYDDTAYALALDAITHPGPADPSRVASRGLPGPVGARRGPGGVPGQLRQDERLGGHDAGHLSPCAGRTAAGVLRHRDVSPDVVAAPPGAKRVGKPCSSRAKIPLSVCLP
jgi:pimeloyl-ACP methyl ester carboxylesterase